MENLRSQLNVSGSDLGHRGTVNAGFVKSRHTCINSWKKTHILFAQLKPAVMKPESQCFRTQEFVNLKLMVKLSLVNLLE